MSGFALAVSTALMLSTATAVTAQDTAATAAPRTLVAVVAHGDDEGPVAPILARYAREGVQVYLVIATDGAQGGRHTSIPRGPELARVRAVEARCATDALGIHPPIFLEFPDGGLADYALLFRLTQRVQAALQSLRPDAVITWGPDGGTGHPDHRLISSVVTQLARAGAPGVPDRLFYAVIPEEGLRAMNPERGSPPMLVPRASYQTMRVPFTPADLEAAGRAMACHRTQFSDDVIRRIVPLMGASWNGVVPLAPAFPSAPGTDLFR